MSHAPRVLPWSPVAAILEARERCEHGSPLLRDPRRVTYSAVWIGRALGSTTRHAAHRRGERVKTAGALTVWEADRIACALSLHPSLIWGEAWWTAAHAPDQVAGVFQRVARQLGAISKHERDRVRDRREWVGQVQQWEARAV